MSQENQDLDFACNCCGYFPIQKVRFRCQVCSNFDLCSSCRNKSLHIEHHPLVEIPIVENETQGVVPLMSTSGKFLYWYHPDTQDSFFAEEKPKLLPPLPVKTQPQMDKTVVVEGYSKKRTSYWRDVLLYPGSANPWKD